MPVVSPVIVKTKRIKTSPTCPRFKCPPGRAVPPPFNTTVRCNLRTHRKKCLSKCLLSLPCIHFFGLWIISSPLHFDLLFASSSGRRWLVRHGSSNGHSTGQSLHVRTREMSHEENLSFVWPHHFTSELHCCS